MGDTLSCKLWHHESSLSWYVDRFANEGASIIKHHHLRITVCVSSL